MKGRNPMPPVRRRRPNQHARTFEFTMAISQPFTPEDVAELMTSTDVALVRMLDGTAELAHYARLGWDINVAGVRVEQIGGDNAQPLQVIVEAAGALNHAQELHARVGTYGLTGPGRHALQAGVDLYRAILAQSSPRQMQLAENEVTRRRANETTA